MRRLFKQFSFPGGIPSHVAPETPGSIHEGGELGYSRLARLRRRLRQSRPDRRLRGRRRRGRDRRRSRPPGIPTSFSIRCATARCCRSCTSTATRSPTRRCWRASATSELESLFEGYGYKPYFVEGEEPAAMHQKMAATLDAVACRDQGHPGPCARAQRCHPAALADDRDAHAQGLDRPQGGRRPEDRGLLALAPGAALRARRQPRARQGARAVDAELPARGAVRRAGQAGAGAARAGAERHPPHGRQSPRQWRHPAQGPAHPRLSRLRHRRAGTRCCGGRGHPGPGRVPARHHEAQHGSGQLPRVRPGRDGLEPSGRAVRGDGSHLGRRHAAGGRSPGARRPGHGDPERAYLPGLAGGLSAHRPARLLLLLRGVHPHHRFDVQPARQVAEDHAQRDPLAAADRLAQLPLDLARLAPGPQRLQPSGSGLHRSRHEQEGERDPRLSAARCQHAAVGRRPLPALARLRQRDRRRQAAGAAMARHGCGGQALHRGHRHLGVGEQRSRHRAGRGDGVRPATCRPWRCWPPSASCARRCRI